MKRIAVIDDHSDNGEILKEVLAIGGFEAQVFTEPHVIIDPALLRLFDLLMVDLAMPDMDGHQLFQHIRRIHRTIPMVAVSANVYPEDIAKARATGFAAFVKKPIADWDDMFGQLRKLLEEPH